MQFPVYPQASLLDSAVVEMSCLARLIFWPFWNEKVTFSKWEIMNWKCNNIFFLVLLNLECFRCPIKYILNRNYFLFFQSPFILVKLLKSATSHCSFKFREQGKAELASLLFADRWQCSYTCWELKKSPPVLLMIVVNCTNHAVWSEIRAICWTSFAVRLMQFKWSLFGFRSAT